MSAKYTPCPNPPDLMADEVRRVWAKFRGSLPEPDRVPNRSEPRRTGANLTIGNPLIVASNHCLRPFLWRRLLQLHAHRRVSPEG